jgi:hypothetical protein
MINETIAITSHDGLERGRNRTPGNVVLGRVRHPETVRRVQVHLERGHSP